ncbi:MAG: UpxY family transcription antiterminator [Candidatus Acidiferrales bacterium]
MITRPQFDAKAEPTIDNGRTGKYPWFALQVRSRHESCVADYLNGQGYEWFLPLYKSRKRWSDRIKEVESPLFPGYLFCRFNQHDRLPILKTPGVIQIVGFNRVPAVVEESEISALQTLMAAGVPNHPCPFLELGDKVRIESGPLRGLEGILMDFKGHHRLVLSVTLLQRSVAVEIDSALVTPVPSVPQSSAENKAHARNRAVPLMV